MDILNMLFRMVEEKEVSYKMMYLILKEVE